MRVGILALQGDFSLHEQRLSEMGVPTLLVRTVEDLRSSDALVLPGGESTALLRLSTAEFREALGEKIQGGTPTLATCAGIILLARHVRNPEQESLGLLDVEVSRNAYGRQLDSFIEPDLTWTSAGREALKSLHSAEIDALGSRTLEGVFIRAPRITSTGKNVRVLVERGLEPVLVSEGNILAATFHPELSDKVTVIHQLLVSTFGNPKKSNIFG